MIILLIIISFLFMEFVAWSNHKYVMHGFLWSLHRDHHKPASPKDFRNYGLLVFPIRFFN